MEHDPTAWPEHGPSWPCRSHFFSRSRGATGSCSSEPLHILRSRAKSLVLELIAVRRAATLACPFSKTIWRQEVRSVLAPLRRSKTPSSSWQPGKQIKQVLSTAALSAGGVLAGCGPPRDPPELRTGADRPNSGLTPSASLAVTAGARQRLVTSLAAESLPTAYWTDVHSHRWGIT